MPTLSHERRGRIAVITIDSPPVNALGVGVRRAIRDGLETANADVDVSGIVLICGGRTYFAGADITEFGKPIEPPHLHDVIRLLEFNAKPVVTAIHGTALGGGLEVALSCHYRIAVPSAKVGLPEVHLGLLPGAGGTQRLPRLVGIPAALELLTSGRSVAGPEALELGIIDRLASPDSLLEDAVAFAEELLAGGEVPVKIRDRAISDHSPDVFDEFRTRNARAFRGREAPEAIIRTVEAAATLPFEEGLKREYELFEGLENGRQSQALRYLLFAERATTKIPDVDLAAGTHKLAKVAVVGAGTMGGGIAMNFLNAGIPVTLIDMTEESLQRGIGVIRRNYEGSVKRGRLSRDALDKRMALITPATDISSAADADLVIEAIFEQLEVKQDLFARLDAVVQPEAILASNTSFLDLNEIAKATRRPESVVGLHFFSPANVMRLLEVVRGSKTSKQVVATAMKLGKTIGKVPVLSGVCHGFIANRIMFARGDQADAMALEGVPFQDIDRVLTDYGFVIGHFQMNDLAGLDVLGRGSSERSVRGDLVAMGRLGQKSGGGYYDYDEARRHTPSPVAARVLADFATYAGIEPSAPMADEAILERLLLPVVNEGARILEEGIALRAADIDVACVLGYGWTAYTGGPMFWADTIGLPQVVEKLKALQAAHGDAFAPAGLLVDMAASGRSFSRAP